MSKPTEAEAAEIAHVFAAALAAFMQTPAYRQWRREQFVKATVQGLCAGMGNYDPSRFISSARLVDDAMSIADAALNRLDLAARAYAPVQP